MQATWWIVAGCWALVALVLPKHSAHADYDGDEITVEMLVLGPDGKPLANAPLRWINKRPSWHYDALPSVEVKTDAQGKARYSGLYANKQIMVIAHGVGQTSTGAIPPGHGSTFRVTLPAMVPIGTVEGTVPEKLRVPETKVWLQGYESIVSPVACDADGHFLLRDVPDGQYSLMAGDPDRNGRERLRAESQVQVAPGEHVAGVLPALPEPPKATEPQQTSRVDERTSSVWAEGTVRDEAGQPIEGANVLAQASYYGGMRMGYTDHATRTDEQGTYKIVGEAHLSIESGTLMVSKFGYSYAVAELRDPWAMEVHESKRKSHPGNLEKGEPEAERQSEDLYPGVRYDFVLPAHGCRLDVLVTFAGRPLADAVVSLSEDLPAQFAVGFFRGSNLAASRTARMISPLTTTDTAGTAHFSDLPPGTYSLVASDSGERGLAAANSRWPREKVGNTGRYQGIVVQPGEPRRFHAELSRADDPVQIELHWPNEANTPKTSTKCEYMAPRGQEYPYNTTIAFDKNWRGSQQFDHSGVWWLKFNFVDSPQKDVTWFRPFFEASVFLAASPLLQGGPPVVVARIRRTRHPGTLTVELQDAAGKPTAGYVYLGNHVYPSRAATVGPDGKVTFEGVLEGIPKVWAKLPGQNFPKIGEDVQSWPDDKSLVGQFDYFVEEVKCPPDKESKVAIRPKPVGYVRGVIRPPAGRSAADYSIQPSHFVSEQQTSLSFEKHYDQKSGRFLMGPLAEGKVELTIWRVEGPWREIATSTAEIRLSHVENLEIVAPAPDKESARSSYFGWYQSIGQVEWPGYPTATVAGNVYLPDGKTPAARARVSLYVPYFLDPQAQGTVGHDGRFWLTRNSAMYTRSENFTKLLAEPHLVAWLPGSLGAATATVPDEPTEPFRLVLPKSVALRGKVVIGGRELTSNSSSISVQAACQGIGVPREPFVQTCNADADGKFEIAALTAGEYRVQAAIDNIWLSQSVLVKIPPDADKLEAVTLDIVEPGCAATVTVVDQQGSPLPSTELTLVRPAGPLTDRLWPKSFTSDQAGVVNVPPLEAGEHTFRLAGEVLDRKLLVPTLTVPHQPVNIKCVVQP